MYDSILAHFDTDIDSELLFSLAQDTDHPARQVVRRLLDVDNAESMIKSEAQTLIRTAQAALDAITNGHHASGNTVQTAGRLDLAVARREQANLELGSAIRALKLHMVG